MTANIPTTAPSSQNQKTKLLQMELESEKSYVASSSKNMGSEPFPTAFQSPFDNISIFPNMMLRPENLQTVLKITSNNAVSLPTIELLPTATPITTSTHACHAVSYNQEPALNKFPCPKDPHAMDLDKTAMRPSSSSGTLMDVEMNDAWYRKGNINVWILIYYQTPRHV